MEQSTTVSAKFSDKDKYKRITFIIDEQSYSKCKSIIKSLKHPGKSPLDICVIDNKCGRILTVKLSQKQQQHYDSLFAPLENQHCDITVKFRPYDFCNEQDVRYTGICAHLLKIIPSVEKPTLSRQRNYRNDIINENLDELNERIAASMPNLVDEFVASVPLKLE